MNSINTEQAGFTENQIEALRIKDAADLLDIVAAVNGVIDFLPAVWKLCEDNSSSETTLMKGLFLSNELYAGIVSCPTVIFNF